MFVGNTAWKNILKGPFKISSDPFFSRRNRLYQCIDTRQRQILMSDALPDEDGRLVRIKPTTGEVRIEAFGSDGMSRDDFANYFRLTGVKVLRRRFAKAVFCEDSLRGWA
jgi:hypothetical protein